MSEFFVRVAIQVFFHLQGYQDAMHYALNAGELLDLSKKDEFVETIIGTVSFQSNLAESLRNNSNEIFWRNFLSSRRELVFLMCFCIVFLRVFLIFGLLRR